MPRHTLSTIVSRNIRETAKRRKEQKNETRGKKKERTDSFHSPCSCVSDCSVLALQFMYPETEKREKVWKNIDTSVDNQSFRRSHKKVGPCEIMVVEGSIE